MLDLEVKHNGGEYNLNAQFSGAVDNMLSSLQSDLASKPLANGVNPGLFFRSKQPPISSSSGFLSDNSSIKSSERSKLLKQ